MANWKRILLKIAPEEVTFARRGFASSSREVRDHLENIGRTFVSGYHAALEWDTSTALTDALNAIPQENRGFAFEGAAMALCLLDCLMPWRRSRLDAFLAGPGADHTYMVHVGAGWALARLKRRVEGPLQRWDPLLGRLAIDGYGFHEGYFHPQNTIERQERPGRWSGDALRVFDQGLGRSLWFVNGADPDRIQATINRFAPNRHADLWSGVGLACAYAGGGDHAVAEAVRCASGPFLPELAQGAAFGAKARQRADNPADHTETACILFCGMSAADAARVTDAALIDLAPEGAQPAYDIWRKRIQNRFSAEVVLT
ncbi:MAG: hypothetical protein JWN14_2609 [Chthonomonadales bacterium]|nr:hypothetical protein [Chthonomonadales bacterium]